MGLRKFLSVVVSIFLTNVYYFSFNVRPNMYQCSNVRSVLPTYLNGIALNSEKK
jgi:hypothetical protein